MDMDPWPTWPVKKEDIRNLANALKTIEEDNRRLVAYLKQATDKIADLKEELAAAQRPLVARPLWRP
jgi:predicted RNase H-like nuclease (RuvC/YqgF family)